MRVPISHESEEGESGDPARDSGDARERVCRTACFPFMFTRHDCLQYLITNVLPGDELQPPCRLDRLRLEAHVDLLEVHKLRAVAAVVGAGTADQRGEARRGDT